MSDADIRPLDWGDLEGGLVRMMDRFLREGTMTGSPDADDFLREHPNAALLGLLYDQRMRAEPAFTGPQRLQERLGHLDMRLIAEMDLEELREVFAAKPAIHRFTNRMAEMTHQVARILADEYDGDAANLWSGDVDFDTIRARAIQLPGFGPQKADKLKYVLHYFGYRDFA